MLRSQPTAAFGRAGRGLLDLVLPPRCLTCGALMLRDNGVCPTCWERLTFLGPPWCRQCGNPLPLTVAAEDALCAGCAARPPPFAAARAALRYDDASRGLILGLKYGDRTLVARPFARWMLHAAGYWLSDADALVPVPLHRWRLLKRRYNQAALLASELTRLCAVPSVPDLLQRVRATRPQQGLSAEQRAGNVVARCFRVHPRHAGRVAGRRFVLIDDVLTSGATVGACVGVLHGAGAERVDVLTLARVVRDAENPISTPVVH